MRMPNYDLKNIYEWPFAARLIFLASVSLLIFYIGFILDINNIRGYINSSYQAEQDLKSQFKDVVDKEVTAKNQISQLPELQQLLAKWEKKMVSVSETPIVLDEIIKIASENHVQINLLDPQREIKDDLYYKTPVKMQMSGTFDSIGSFISQVANMPKMVVINNFTIIKETPSASAAPENKMLKTANVSNIELTLEIYRK